jgi:hypothetical protein
MRNAATTDFAPVPGVYRSGYPQKKNFEFMKTLSLKTIIFLCQEEYSEVNMTFCRENRIELKQEYPQSITSRTHATHTSRTRARARARTHTHTYTYTHAHTHKTTHGGNTP